MFRSLLCKWFGLVKQENITQIVVEAERLDKLYYPDGNWAGFLPLQKMDALLESAYRLHCALKGVKPFPKIK